MMTINSNRYALCTCSQVGYGGTIQEARFRIALRAGPL